MLMLVSDTLSFQTLFDLVIVLLAVDEHYMVRYRRRYSECAPVDVAALALPAA